MPNRDGGPLGSPVLVAFAASEQDVARATAEGADLIYRDPAEALTGGIPAGRPLAEVSPWEIEEAAAAGFATLVDADRAADRDGSEAPAEAAVVAVAAICTWLGASAISTAHVRAVRRAIDMTAAIRGTRPPARAVRGLG